MLSLAKDDVRTTTGMNLRTIMLWSGRNSIDEILKQKIDVEYHKLEEHEAWKVDMIREIIDAIQGYTDVNLNKEELTDILEYLCTG